MPKASTPLSVVLVKRSRSRVPQAFLKAWVQSLDKLAVHYIDARRYRGRELTIAVLSRTEMRKLNRQFRGKDRPTDVLSFAGDSPDSLGELAISMEVIAKQAREHGLLVREELGYMVIHGFLHLLGYDHERSPREARKMFQIQDELFEKLLASRKQSR